MVRERDAVLFEIKEGYATLANIYKRVLKEQGLLQEQGLMEIPELKGADVADMVIGFVKGAKDIPGGTVVKGGIIGWLKGHRQEVNEFVEGKFEEIKQNAQTNKDAAALSKGRIPQ